LSAGEIDIGCDLFLLSHRGYLHSWQSRARFWVCDRPVIKYGLSDIFRSLKCPKRFLAVIQLAPWSQRLRVTIL